MQSQDHNTLTEPESQLLFSNNRRDMTQQDKGFDGDAFYRALANTVSLRTKTWKQVAEETGVSATTLARMAQGRRPDAASLAALSAWAGINPSDFVNSSFTTKHTEAISQISTLLRSDPNLDTQAADTLEAIIRAAYETLRKNEK